MTIEDKYPIPNVHTLFYRLAGANVFSKVDLVKAYHQIPIDPESIPLTTIITPFGLFEYLYMPFGLRNASATFQRYMDKVLQGMKNVIAYVDDIIVFSSSEDQHKRDLNELFQRFHRHKIVINPAKSKFGMCNLNFLGHLVTPEGILPLRDKVKAVEDYPRPYNHKQLRAFLGFINYYHRFVHNMAHHLAPLYNLLKNSKSKNQVIDWNDEVFKHFNTVRKCLQKLPP